MAKPLHPGRNQRLGKLGEKLVEDTLSSKNWTLLDKNVFTPYGEIDLIAKENTLIHFIEVKTRTSVQFGQPELAMTPAKLSHFSQASAFYMQEHHELGENWQLDVASVHLDSKNLDLQDIVWFENVC